MEWSISPEAIGAATRAALPLLFSPLDTAELRRRADGAMAEALGMLAAELDANPVHGLPPRSVATRRQIGRRLLYIAAVASDETKSPAARYMEIAQAFGHIRGLLS
jgi:hypothetical protein